MHTRVYFSDLFIVFLINYAASVQRIALDDSYEEPPPESLFADVIKNITRVNNVLKELIKNYERLQKIYKSQETIENETDSNYKKIYVRDGKTEKAKTQLTTRHIANFPATKLLLSEQSSENETKNMVEERAPPMIAHFKYGAVTKPKIEPVIVSEASSEVSTSEETNKSRTLTKNKPLLEKIGTNTTASYLVASKKPNEFEISKNVEINIRAQSGIPKLNKSMPFKKQTNKNEFESNKILELRTKHRPVNSEPEKDVFSKRYAQAEEVNNTSEIDVKRNKSVFARIPYLNGSRPDADSDYGDLDNIKKEQYKTKTLSQEFGKHCLKVVVKRCVKAIKTALKTTKKTFRFKSDTVEAFKKNIVEKCHDEYYSHAGRNLGLKEKINGRNNTEVDGVFSDMSRHGYLAPACVSKEKHDNKTLRENTGVEEDLIKLRDAYEKACFTETRSKCKSACKQAIHETCEDRSNDCLKIKLKELQKQCNKECRKLYEESSSSSSDSDSDSDEGRLKGPKGTNNRTIAKIKTRSTPINLHLTSPKRTKRTPNHPFMRSGEETTTEFTVKTWQKVDLSKLRNGESEGIEVTKKKYVEMQGRGALSE